MKGAIGFALVLAFVVFCVPVGGAEKVTLQFESVGSSEQIPATLVKPDGEGPFPAVVIMHDCSGLGRSSSGGPLRWAEELVQQRYVVLIPDSFTPRGFPDGVCTLPYSQAANANGYVRSGDAYGALLAVRKLPYVDGKRIGIMGASHGGWTTLASMCAPADEKDLLSGAKGNGFAAAVALYPACAVRYGSWSTVRQNKTFGPVVSHSGVYKPIAPVLILIGEKDDWDPAEDCRKMVDVSRDAGFPIRMITYSGAHHAFDSTLPVRYVAQRTNASSPTGKGATTGGDYMAWSDAKKQVASFFNQHLKR
jgi:dienelactone hydrolase